MTKSHLIAGVGELVYDHIFVVEGERFRYRGSRGGGPIFNMLANIVLLGGDSEAFGVGGEDWFGRAAKKELDKLGIATSGLSLLPNKTSRIIFEKLYSKPQDYHDGSRHTFSTKCLVCKSEPPERKLAHISRIDSIQSN